MFTKEDYEKYFDQIAHVERKMIYGVYDLAREVDDTPIARVLQRVGDDEIRHYGLVLKMLRMADPGRPESRREIREHYLGTIHLKDIQNPASGEIHARCVNLSKIGICLECKEDLPISGVWDLEIQLFDKNEKITRRGRVIWSKNIEPDFYISGLEFEA